MTESQAAEGGDLYLPIHEKTLLARQSNSLLSRGLKDLRYLRNPSPFQWADLYRAILNAKSDRVKFILRSNPTLTTTRDKLGRTLFQCVASAYPVEIFHMWRRFDKYTPSTQFCSMLPCAEERGWHSTSPAHRTIFDYLESGDYLGSQGQIRASISDCVVSVNQEASLANPELTAAIAELSVIALRAKIFVFRDYVRFVAETIGEEMTRRMGSFLPDGWERVRAAFDTTMDAAESVENALDTNGEDRRKVVDIAAGAYIACQVALNQDKSAADLPLHICLGRTVIALSMAEITGLAERRAIVERLENSLQPLKYKERETLRLLYGFCDGWVYTHEEVGRIFKSSSNSVRRIEAKALAKIDSSLRSRCQAILEHLSQKAGI